MAMESLYRLSILVNMIDRISMPAARIGGVIGDTTSKFQAYSSAMAGMARDGVVLMGTGYQIANAAIAPVKATFATKDAIAELSSLGIEKLGLLEDAATSFSTTWAGTTKPEFLTAAYDIKSGIESLSDEGVASYTALAGVTAKATKSTIGEMTSLFATGYSIYKDYYGDLSDLEFGEIFSGGISQSVKQFKTTGSGMAQAISALGGSATSAKVPLEEQLTILGMLQATMSGSEAGTKYTAFLQTAAKAGEDLGLNFLDAAGQLKSMPEMLGIMQGKFGDVLTAADKLELQKAFGTVEAVKLIDLLYGKTDDLQGNILTLYDTMGRGMSITDEMANKINAPPGQSWELFKQTLQSTLETVGNAMTPRFIELQKAAGDTLGKISDWVTKHPELTSTIMYSVAAFGMFLAALGALKFGIGGLVTIVMGCFKIKAIASGALKGIEFGIFAVKYAAFIAKPVLLALGKGFLMVGGAVAKASLALLASPITWIVLGIIALIAVIILLWKNWDTVTAFLQNTWDKVCGGIGTAIAWVREKLDAIPDSFKWILAAIFPFIGIPLLIFDNWDTIRAFFATLPEKIVDGFLSLPDRFAAFFGGLATQFRESGSKIITTFTEGIKAAASKPIDAVKGVLQKIRNMLPFSDAKEGPLSELTLSGRRVFETFDAGMKQSAELPSQTADTAFGGIATSSAAAQGASPSKDEKTATVTRQTVIQQVVFKVAVDNIDTLKKVEKLIHEFEDAINSGDPEPQATPTPA